MVKHWDRWPIVYLGALCAGHTPGKLYHSSKMWWTFLCILSFSPKGVRRFLLKKWHHCDQREAFASACKPHLFLWLQQGSSSVLTRVLAMEARMPASK